MAVGVFDDEIGRSGVIKIAGTQHERRWPKGTPLETVQKWQRRMKARAEFPDLPAEVRGNSLRQDAAAYLALLPAGRGKREASALLDHWLPRYGSEPRSALTPTIIHAQLLAWRRDGAAPQSCNHRRRVLVSLWRVLDGPSATNPARLAPKLHVPPSEPRGLPWATITAILDALRPSKAKARIAVMAHTGFPQSTIARIEPGDLHLDGPRPYVIVRPRRKGKGTQTRAIPITPQAVAVFREFIRLEAFGAFNRHGMYHVFVKAATKAGAPAGTRPYDLRHSHAVRLYALTKDLRAVSELMIHANMNTTARYAAQSVAVNAQAAIDALAGTAAGTAKTARKQARKRTKRQPV